MKQSPKRSPALEAAMSALPSSVLRETLAPILLHAGEIALTLRAHGLTVEEKADGTLVTNADHALSEYLIHAIERTFPGDGIVSEEHPDTSGIGVRRTWTIDPIDGTKHFATGKDIFCVMVCLLDPEPAFALAYYPILDRWYVAERGKGAWLITREEVRRLHVRMPLDPPALEWSPSSAYETGQPGSHGTMKNLCRIARGELDAYANGGIAYWDLAPPTLILTEAGGIVVGWDGKPVSFDTNHVVQDQYLAGHPGIVQAVLRDAQPTRRSDAA